MSAPTTVNGVWFGSAVLGNDQLAVRVDLREQRGSLRGILYMGDPGAGELLDAGQIYGTRTAGTATWKTNNKVNITGSFADNSFAGSLVIEQPDRTKVDAALELDRVPSTRRGYVPITPTRLADTRDQGGSPVAAGGTLIVPVAGKGGVPYEGVAAVVVNITGTEATGRGYLTAWASGSAQPFTANAYLETAGQTAGNLAIVPVGDDGYIKVFSQSGTHLVVDAFGWFPADSILRRVEPQRAFDTRPESAVGYSGPKPGPGTTVTASVAGIAGIPASGVAAVVVNITATDATAAGYITAWALGAPRPLTANLNVEQTGQTIGNLAIVPVNDASAMDLFSQSGTHLIVDVLGWFADEPVGGPAGRLPAAGSLVRDGSFEPSTSVQPTLGFSTIDTRATIGSWMVVEGAVDHVGPNSGEAFDGDHWVDLNGNGYGPGVIEQLVPTTAGRRYRVSFQMSGNPNGAPTVKELEVGFGDQLRRYTFDVTGHTNDDLGWTEVSFTANPDCGSSTVLSFRSLTPGDKGPNIDAIRVLDDGPSDSCRQGGYRAVGPVRLLDTRPESVVGYEGGKPGAGAEVRVQISGREGIPTGLAAVVVNLTATAADDAGFVTAWASGTERPFTSSLNIDRPGQTRPNHAIVPVGQDGAITLYTLNGTHLVVDVFGYFTG